MSPITDYLPAIAVLEGGGTSGNLARADQLQLEVIEAILPAPAAPIPVDELRRFKDEHRQRLSRLRTRIEKAVLDAITAPDAGTRGRQIEMLRRELQDELEEVEAEMHRRRWPQIIFGAVCGIGAATATAAAAAAGGVVPGLMGVPSLLSSIYVAARAVESKDKALRSPLAYAALAQERSRHVALRSRSGSGASMLRARRYLAPPIGGNRDHRWDIVWDSCIYE